MMMMMSGGCHDCVVIHEVWKVASLYQNELIYSVQCYAIIAYHWTEWEILRNTLYILDVTMLTYPYKNDHLRYNPDYRCTYSCHRCWCTWLQQHIVLRLLDTRRYLSNHKCKSVFYLRRQEAQLPQRNSASVTRVFLGRLTDRAIHWTPQML